MMMAAAVLRRRELAPADFAKHFFRTVILFFLCQSVDQGQQLLADDHQCLHFLQWIDRSAFEVFVQFLHFRVYRYSGQRHLVQRLAQTLPADSEDFREVFEVAVRLYPDDPVANLNAAFTAMRFGDLGNAGRYLAKAGDSTSAVYARGIFAAMQGDYEAARRNLESVSTLPQAVDALGQLREMGKI